VAHELDELIPKMDMHFALCYHRILFTHIPGNHDASEAYPLVDAPRKGKKRKIGKLVSTERKKNGKEKNGKKKKRRAPKVQKLGSPEAHGEKP